MIKVAIFASGSGTNATRIIDYFGSNSDIIVDLILTNRKKAGVVLVAERIKIPIRVVSKEVFADSPDSIVSFLVKRGIDFIVLAGFLLKVPPVIINKFDGRILNIHPSLLPAFGGTGMYGDHVHQAVLNSKELRSGITIHKVNEEYDQGDIVFQKAVELDKDETLTSLKAKIQTLEHLHFPSVIEDFIKSSFL